jgi:hypothetical protein
MFLELVTIPDALHTPDNQFLTKTSFIRDKEMKKKRYLCPRVEVFHDLSHGDLAFEVLALLGCPNFCLGRLSA